MRGDDTGIHLPDGALRHGDDPVLLTAGRAGWRYAGLRVLALEPGIPRTLDTGDHEVFVLPLAGGCEVATETERFHLRGRTSVFSRVTDFAYLGRGRSARLSSVASALIAVPMAPARRSLPARYVPADAVPVEVRGAGNATRQVTNFGAPGVFDGADRLMACELITPAGNWSSYPPHKHDTTCPVANEEIYYYRVAVAGGTAPSGSGFGLHRTYDDTLDVTVEVHDGDVCLVPHGYHGPCAAAPGYDLYYLNVLAGPGEERSMSFCDDPAHTWVREQWDRESADPRCPVTSATGRADREGPLEDPSRLRL
ncbi:5-deoxy-glucuronate isomerase [Actinomadura madurae]|uniref:5-deoxy-glucuronate isomerase n=1 Tax=Actinomadura madurae TaxID=1993 RepID=UPI00399BE1BF